MRPLIQLLAAQQVACRDWHKRLLRLTTWRSTLTATHRQAILRVCAIILICDYQTLTGLGWVATLMLGFGALSLFKTHLPIRAYA